MFPPCKISIKYNYISSSRQYLYNYCTRFILCNIWSSLTTLLRHYPQIDVRNHIVTMPYSSNVLRGLLFWMWRTMCYQKTCIYHRCKVTSIAFVWLLSTVSWIHILVTFGFSPLCVFKCVLTVRIFWPQRAAAEGPDGP